MAFSRTWRLLLASILAVAVLLLACGYAQAATGPVAFALPVSAILSLALLFILWLPKRAELLSPRQVCVSGIASRAPPA